MNNPERTAKPKTTEPKTAEPKAIASRVGRIYIHVEFDPEITDERTLAFEMCRELKAALADPEVRERLGLFKIGEFRPASDLEPIKTKYVETCPVIDPDTEGQVEVEIRKLETGGMVGIDTSWLASGERPTYSPYDEAVELDILDDEESLAS